jgi:hypothetical protein
MVQVGDIRAATILGVLIQHHPHEVRIQNTLSDTVWVFDGIGPSMMCPVLVTPPPNGALDRTTADAGKKNP